MSSAARATGSSLATAVFIVSRSFIAWPNSSAWPVCARARPAERRAGNAQLCGVVSAEPPKVPATLWAKFKLLSVEPSISSSTTGYAGWPPAAWSLKRSTPWKISGLGVRGSGRKSGRVAPVVGTKSLVAEAGDSLGVQVGVTLTCTAGSRPAGRSTSRSCTRPKSRSRWGYSPRVEIMRWKSIVGFGVGFRW